jgi:hypothetical protein
MYDNLAPTRNLCLFARESTESVTDSDFAKTSRDDRELLSHSYGIERNETFTYVDGQIVPIFSQLLLSYDLLYVTAISSPHVSAMVRILAEMLRRRVRHTCGKVQLHLHYGGSSFHGGPTSMQEKQAASHRSAFCGATILDQKKPKLGL